MRTKFLLSIILVIVVTAVLIALGIWYESKKVFERDIQKRIIGVSDQIKDELTKNRVLRRSLLQNIISCADKDIRKIALSVGKDFSGVRKLLDQLCEKYNLASVCIVDNEGKLVCSDSKAISEYDCDIPDDTLKRGLGQGQVFALKMVPIRGTSRLFKKFCYSPSQSKYFIITSYDVEKMISARYGREFYEMVFLNPVKVKDWRYSGLRNIDVITIDGGIAESLTHSGRSVTIPDDTIRNMKLFGEAVERDGWKITVYKLIYSGMVRHGNGTDYPEFLAAGFDMTQSESKLVYLLFKVILVIVVVSIGVVITFSPFFNRIFISKILSINNGLEALSQGDFSGKIDVDGDDEFARIATNVNEMSVKLLEWSSSLFNSEKRLRSILDSLPLFITLCDKHGNPFFFNRSWSKLGYSPEKLRKKNFTELIKDPINMQILSYLEKLVDGSEKSRRYEMEYFSKDGELVYVKAVFIPIYDDNSGDPKILIMAEDVTRNKITEEKLEESTTWYRAFWEYSAEGIGLIDIRERYFVRANPRIMDMMGYSEYEMLNLKIDDIVPAAKQGEFFDIFDDQIISGNMGYEFELQRKDGSTFFADVAGAVIELKKNKYFLMFFKDVTERVEADEIARKAQMERKTILENTSDFISFIDNNMNIVWANKSPFGREELSVDDMFGRPCYEVGCNHRENCEQCPVTEVMRTGESCEREMDCHNGSSLLISAEPVRGSSGEIVGSINTVRDITELRKLERQLFQAQKMDAVGKLAGGVAHDFNNLLQIILGYGELVGLAITDQQTRELWSNVMDAGNKGKRLVNQLLSFSRSKSEAQYETVCLNEAIENFRKMIGRILGEHVHLDIDLIDEKTDIVADIGQIEQVLMNLCVNARDAMPEGGTLSITTQCVNLDPRYIKADAKLAKGRYICCTVTDTGVGMNREVSEKIFEPFFTTKEVNKGTGLGLSTVYAIVKRHHGIIEVESKKDKGTAFKIYFPLKTASEPIDTEEPEVIIGEMVRLPGDGRSVLLVEDEELVRLYGTDILREAGYKVTAARDGVEALKFFDSNPEGFDLALIDAILPKRSGKEVAAKIREKRPNIPVVFCSGYNEDSLNELSREFLVTKPYGKNDMLNILSRALGIV